MLSVILSGKAYRPLGAPIKKASLATVTRDLANLSTSTTTMTNGTGMVGGGGGGGGSGLPVQSQETVALALRTLSSFDFGGASPSHPPSLLLLLCLPSYFCLQN